MGHVYTVQLFSYKIVRGKAKSKISKLIWNLVLETVSIKLFVGAVKVQIIHHLNFSPPTPNTQIKFSKYSNFLQRSGTEREQKSRWILIFFFLLRVVSWRPLILNNRTEIKFETARKRSHLGPLSSLETVAIHS